MTFKLTPDEFADKVADALESGRFTQIRGRLKDDLMASNGRCCLGVACEVFIESGGELETDESGYRIPLYAVSEKMILPYRVAEALGSDSCNPSVYTRPVAISVEDHVTNDFETLSGLNDSGIPFKEIAGIFRRREFRRPKP